MLLATRQRTFFAPGLARRRGSPSSCWRASRHPAGEVLFRLQQLDHRPGGLIHGLVQVGVFAGRDEGVAGLGAPASPRSAFSRMPSWRCSNVAQLMLTHLAHAAIPFAIAVFAACSSPTPSLCAMNLAVFAFKHSEGLIEILVDPNGNPGIPRFDPWPVELHGLYDLDRYAHLLIGGLKRSEVDFAIALGRVQLPVQSRAPFTNTGT